MDEKYQKILLEELYRYYPNFTINWMDRLSTNYFLVLPSEEEQKKNIAWLKEEGYIEQQSIARGYLRITSKGVTYLKKLKKESQQEAKK